MNSAACLESKQAEKKFKKIFSSDKKAAANVK